MGNLLGGGSGGSGGGLLGGGGGNGFLGGLLGGLPDPLGLGKMLGITGKDEGVPGASAQGPMGQPQPSGVQFAGPPASGVSFDPRSMGSSPMGPTGFGVGGGGQGR